MIDKYAQVQNILKVLGINAIVIGDIQGRVTTTYELHMVDGEKSAKLKRAKEDIRIRLKAETVQIVQMANNSIGIEVSNKSNEILRIGDIIRSSEYKSSTAPLKFAIGESQCGEKIYGSLPELRNILIAGASGSGKSVFINVLISSLIMEPVKELRLVLLDPKKVELTPYENIPHLLAPVITDEKKAEIMLEWLCEETNRRYELLNQIAKLNNIPIRNIDRYNEILEKNNMNDKKLYRIVVIIDELSQLIMSSSKKVEDAIIKISQLSRAAGIHLIVATQRPSADIITSRIKDNLQTKIVFAVDKPQSSMVALGRTGAESLLGKGDMLFKRENDMNPMRIQGAYISDDEVERVINYFRSKNIYPVFDKSIIDALEGKHGNNSNEFLSNIFSGLSNNGIY